MTGDLAVIASPYFFGRERVNMGCGADAILAAGLVDALTSEGIPGRGTD